MANLLVWLACVGAKAMTMAALDDLKLFVEESLAWIAGHLEYYGARHEQPYPQQRARPGHGAALQSGDDGVFRAGMRTFSGFFPRLVATEGFLRERSSHHQLIVANWVLLTPGAFVHARFGGDDPRCDVPQGYALRMVAAAAMLCGRGVASCWSLCRGRLRTPRRS